MEKVSFIIAEKSYIIRTGLMKIINSFPGTSVIKEISDVNNLAKSINKYKPDFLIINAKLVNDPHDDIRRLFSENINTKFIIFTGSKREKEHFVYFDEQISVDESKTDIIKKLNILISENSPKSKTDENTGLSGREKDVVRQIALGKTNKEIAEELFISTHTVITHRKNITGKLGIKTVSGLTVYAILNNIIDIDEGV
ncbi:MAG: response regulator transcription factor [Bacteroidales bacterium]|nr:response regulator transcription factor [Bacteroidales bacterium]